ncbi:metal-responsive CopG/Arc/MetJ family transcriptional regulator [Bradyrhizobium sp. USDA 4472]
MSETLSERIIIPMAESLVEAVDDFRFANRMPSRAEAIRHLLLAGLAAKAQPATQAPLSSLLLAAYKAAPIETLASILAPRQKMP